MFKRIIKNGITKDYSKFKRLPGNRTHDEIDRRLLKDITTAGAILVPIIVNENMEVCDGQHRLDIAKMFSLPVPYTVIEGFNISDTISANTTGKQWTRADFIASQAELGDESAQLLNELIKRYSGRLPMTTVLIIANRGFMLHESRGRVEITMNNKKYNESCYLCDYVCRLLNCLNVTNKKVFVTAIAQLYYAGAFSADVMEEKIKQYGRVMYNNAQTVETAVEALETIYNYHNRKKVYFREKWESFKKGGKK